ARDAAVRGEWLLPGDLDKTSLAIYGQSLMMLLVGIRWDADVGVWRLPVQVGEFAARLWSLYASVLLVAAVGRLAHILRASPIGIVLAAALMAVSPLAIAYGAVAFTDTPMLLFAVFALMFAAQGRGAWAGIALVMAYGSKQQGAIFVPLVMFWLWYSAGPRAVFVCVLALALGLGVGSTWELLRSSPSVLALATANNAPGGWLVPFADLPTRTFAWIALARYLVGGIGGLFSVGLVIRRGRRLNVYGRTTLLFGMGYLLLHLLVPLNVYDRYLLPLVPLMAVVIALLVNDRLATLITVSVVLVALPLAWRTPDLPIGGDRGEHAGIIALADHLNDREFGAIVYDRWLGWELNYYLGGWSDKRRAYYPTPTAMACDDALYVTDVAPRYLPVPRRV
ncbi:MAG: hypothetical protein AAF125_26065, partial [Chloroflexota bacterium]